MSELPQPPAREWLHRWQTGQPGDVRLFLAKRRLSPIETVGVLLVEQRERWQVGERLLAESFFSWCPELRANAEAAVELIYGEFLLRQQFGENPSSLDYQQRFPDFADWLTRQFALHSALQDSSHQSVATIACLKDEAAGNATQVPDAVSDMVANRYELGDEIAHGGMGVVLRCRDHHLQRDLAVKVLHEKLRGREDVYQRFLEEARITGQLQHPAVVPIHELGTLPDGRPFFAMKLVQGRTLAELLKGRAEPSQDRSRFVGVFQQVCQAVAFAHSKGIIHRDLKPSNVMVGAFGEVQVMDWGLAKRVMREDESDFSLATHHSPLTTPVETQAGTALGTLAYMPPEQARGELQQVDRRSDVFGLGAILCELLTGGPPYSGKKLDLEKQARQGQLGPAFERLDHSGADAELVGLAKNCLQVRSEERPSDASAVEQAVAGYLATVVQRLRRAEMETAAAQAKAVEERKRRRVQVGLVAAVLALVLLGGAGAWWYQRQEEQRTQSVEASLERAGELRGQERWKELRLVLDQAKSRLGEGGSEELRHRLKLELEQLGQVERLEAIRLKKANWVAGSGALRTADEEYTSEFQQLGIAISQDNPSVVAQRVQNSPIKFQLIAALDDWASFSPNDKLREWLLEVSRRMDAEGLRYDLLDPKLWRDPSAFNQRLEKVKADELSPALATMLGLRLTKTKGNGIALLKAAQQRHPNDFWLAFTLGYALGSAKRTEEAISYYRVALALRPDTPAVAFNLGLNLRDLKQLDAALAEFQRAIALNPEYAEAYGGLADVLIHVPGDGVPFLQ